jgi:hypothetical protein
MNQPRTRKSDLLVAIYVAHAGWTCLAAAVLALGKRPDQAGACALGGVIFLLLLSSWHLVLHFFARGSRGARAAVFLFSLLRYTLLGLAFYAIIRLLGERVQLFMGWFIAGFSLFLPGILTAMWWTRRK